MKSSVSCCRYSPMSRLCSRTSFFVIRVMTIVVLTFYLRNPEVLLSLPLCVLPVDVRKLKTKISCYKLHASPCSADAHPNTVRRRPRCGGSAAVAEPDSTFCLNDPETLWMSLTLLACFTQTVVLLTWKRKQPFVLSVCLVFVLSDF